MWGKASRGGARRRKLALLICVATASFAMLALYAAPAMALSRSTAVSLAATGDTYTWTGNGSATNTNWSNAQNWSCSGPGCVSGSTPISETPSDVVFPASPTGGNYTPTIDQPAEVNSLTLNSANYVIRGSGGLTVDGATTLEGAIEVGGAQTYDGAVTVAGSGNDELATSGLVTLNGDVNAEVAGDQSLLLNAPAVINAPIGNSVPLHAIGDSGGFSQTINTSQITVDGEVLLGGPVTLEQDTTISAEWTHFGQTDGGYSLTADGSISFSGPVGSVTPLTQLTTTGVASLGSVTTTGSQVYEQGIAGASEVPISLSGTTITSDGSVVPEEAPVIINGSATLGDGGSQITDVTVSGSLDLTGGTLELTGDLDVGGTLDATGANVEFDGDGTQQIQGSGISFGGVDIGGGTTVDLHGNSVTSGALTGGGELTDSGSAVTIALAPTGADYYGGSITGPISLSMAGSGFLSLGGPLEYSGATDLTSGTITFLSDPLNSTNITDNGHVDFDFSGSPTYSGVISGSGDVTQSGSGVLTLSGANTYGGGTTITDGLIRFFDEGNFGTGNITLNGGGVQWGTGNSADISSRLNPLGADGGVLDTDGNYLMFLTPITGSGSLTITGGGSAVFTSSNTYSDATNVESGSAAFWKNLAGALNVDSGASALAEGIVSGPVTVDDGTLTCDNGTLNGGVTNNGGTLSGGPDAPTGVTATGGTGQATVRFTPGTANCYPVSYTVAASPGGQSASGSGSPITVSGLSDNTSYTFTVTETNPVGSTTSSPSASVLTGPGAPTARISSPSNGRQYTLNEHVATSFNCADAPGGPGIANCIDSNGAAAGAGTLDTSTLGLHIYTVTATSHDGQRGASSIAYTVVSPPPGPSNKFTLAASDMKLVNSCGIAGLKLTLPGPGAVKVLETFAPHAKAFGQTQATAARAETLRLTVKPNRHGARLIKRHRRLKLTLKVSFTPTGGTRRAKTISGIRVRGECPAPH